MVSTFGKRSSQRAGGGAGAGWGWSLLGWLLTWLAPSAVLAWEPPSILDPDVLQTVAARKALLEDQQLAGLNLGVKVQKRVAVLWGPVPSAELARRAVEVVRQIPGLVAVKSQLEIVPEEDPLFLPDALAGKTSLPIGAPGQLTNRTFPKNPANNEKTWKRLQGSKNDPRIPDQREIDVAMPSLRIPIPSLEPKTPEQAIKELQKDGRFARIKMEIQGKVVYLTDANQSPALFELAQIISRLPGVERVVVKE